MNESFNLIANVGSIVENGRTLKDVMIKVAEETGEIAAVVSSLTGHTNYKKDQEELVGEIADLIIAAVDLGNLHYGADFNDMLAKKIESNLLNGCLNIVIKKKMIKPEIKTTTTVSIGEYSLEEFLDLVKDSAHYALEEISKQRQAHNWPYATLEDVEGDMCKILDILKD